jgi:hypothetical protein
MLLLLILVGAAALLVAGACWLMLRAVRDELTAHDQER